MQSPYPETTPTLYADGAAVASSSSFDNALASLGFTNKNYLGKSIWKDDEILGGQWHEVRIYNHALTEQEMLQSFQNGPNGIPEPTGFGFPLLAAVFAINRRSRRVR